MSFLRQSVTSLSSTLQKWSLSSNAPTSSLGLMQPGGLFSIFVRNNIRVHFPRPSEVKRVRTHGWAKRMSTPGGRRILMRRLLKGRFVYSH